MIISYLLTVLEIGWSNWSFFHKHDTDIFMLMNSDSFSPFTHENRMTSLGYISEPKLNKLPSDILIMF